MIARATLPGRPRGSPLQYTFTCNTGKLVLYGRASRSPWQSNHSPCEHPTGTACRNPQKRVYCNWMLLYVLPIILITRRLERTTECDKLKIHSGNDHEEAYLAWNRCTNFPCHAARAAYD